MGDYEKLQPEETPKRRHKRKSKMKDRDDIGGMLLNMFNKIDPRKMCIIWVFFLFLHSEMCAEKILKRFKGTVNDDLTLTMTGTLWASIMMLLVVMICELVFC